MLKFSKKIVFLMTLVPLVIAMVVSCSSAPEKVELTHETTQHWNAMVEKTIAEPERAAKLKQLGQQLIDVSSSIQKDIETLQNHYHTNPIDYII